VTARDRGMPCRPVALGRRAPRRRPAAHPALVWLMFLSRLQVCEAGIIMSEKGLLLEKAPDLAPLST